MKLQTRNIGKYLAGALALFALSTQPLMALYWVPNPVGSGTVGGNGEWNTTDEFWSNVLDVGSGTATFSAWDNSAPVNATFLLSNTVTINGVADVSSLSLGAAGQGAISKTSISSGTLHVANVGSGQVPITVASGTHNIDSTVLWTHNGYGGANLIRFGAAGTLTIKELKFDSSSTRNTFGVDMYGGSTITFGQITKTSVSTGTTGGMSLDLGSASSSEGAYYLNGNNTGLAALSFTRGTLYLGNNGAIGAGTSVSVSGGTGGTGNAKVLISETDVILAKGVSFSAIASGTTASRVIGGNHASGTATFNGTVTLGNFNGKLLQVTSQNADTVTVFGLINDGTNTTGITTAATNLGIVKFNRAAGNTYDGGTNVTVGTLLVNNTEGSGAGTGAVTVSANATFGGNGIVSGTVTLNAGAKFSPGDMNLDASNVAVSEIGIFTGSDLIWNSNGANGLYFDLGAGGDADLLALSGAFTKGTGSDFVFNFTDLGLTAGEYTLVTFDSTNFTLGDFSFVGIDAGLGLFNLGENSLSFTVIPEPSTWLLLTVGAGLIAVLRRRNG